MRLKKSRIDFIFILIGITLISGNLYADSLSVEQAIELAYKNNPEINILKAKLDGKKGEYWKYWGLYSPEIYFMKEGINKSDNINYAEKQIGITQEIDFPLTSYYRLRRNDYEELALEKEVIAKKRKIRGEVKKVYAQLVHALTVVKIGINEKNSTIKLKKAVETRHVGGQVSEIDLLKAEIEYANIVIKTNQMERDFHTFRYRLFELIGMKPRDQKYIINFPDSLVFIDHELDQSGIIKKISKQPEYQGAALQIKSGEQGVKAAWSNLFPTVSLQYYQQNFMGEYDSYGYQMGFTVPLWFWAEPRSEIRGANAKRNELFWQKEQIKQKLKREIQLAWHNYDISRKSIILFKEQIFEKSKKLFDMSYEAYKSGSIDILSFLDTQRMYFEDQREYYRLLEDYYIHLIDLERFLPEEIIFSNNN